MSGPSYIVILMPSTSHAIHAEAVLKAAGIPCKMIPVPRQISSDCGVCIRVAREHREPARAALDAAAVAWEGMHEVGDTPSTNESDHIVL